MSALEDIAREQLNELRIGNQTQTARAARLASQVTNGCLDAFTAVLDASGQLSRAYHVAIGSIVITNNTAALVTITSSAPGPSAPASGQGVHIIPAGLVMTVPIDSRAFTVYGVVAGQVALQVWTGLQPYGCTQ